MSYTRDMSVGESSRPADLAILMRDNTSSLSISEWFDILGHAPSRDCVCVDSETNQYLTHWLLCRYLNDGKEALLLISKPQYAPYRSGRGEPEAEGE